MIGIHKRPGSFSDHWIEYCKVRGIPFKIVDCHRSDIIEQLSGCDALMWHFSHGRIEDILVAHAIVKSAEAMGIPVFPDSATSWHFDDKVAQKYLLEALGLPLVPSYTFLSRDEALRWAGDTAYPKVFKLRSGAGAVNVSLVNNKRQAEKIINRAFGPGFPPVSRWAALRERWWHFKRDKTWRSFIDISRGFARAAKVNPQLRKLGWQKNYAYFQDFMPNNDSDIRVIVIGRRAFAIKRMVRDGDFRASGSGHIVYDPAAIPKICINRAFQVSRAVRSQSIALDFVFYQGQPWVVEISYAFSSQAYKTCPGYWLDDGSWVNGPVLPEEFMLEDLLVKMEGVNEVVHSRWPG